MIKELNIKNFKSIKDLKMSCKKLNVFIGEPNSGKSNIIEALALQSQNAIGQELNKNMFRYKTLGNLFYDYNISKAIEVNTGEKHTKLEYAINEQGASLNSFNFYLDANIIDKNDTNNYIRLKHNGTVQLDAMHGNTNVRYYEFKRLDKFNIGYNPNLTVPNGDNIPTLLLSNQELKKWVSGLFHSFGYKLMLKPEDGEMSMAKDINEELYEYPYFTISETLQRLIFYTLAVKSNKNNVLLFDEPESNMFPFYIKEFAERIADDKTNQFFISTHNPYLLGSLLEKSNKDDIAVFIAKMVKYETTIHPCNQEQIDELLTLDIGSFFNLDNIIEP